MPARIGLKPLAELCRRAGTAHAAGVDARTIWKREAERGNAAQRRHLSVVSQAINRGSTIGEALAKTGDYFPPLARDMVEVGERTGKVDEALNRLARHYEHMRAVRSAFLAGISWPMFQLFIAVIVIGAFIGLMGLFPKEDSIDILGFGLVGLRGVTVYSTIVGALVLFAFLVIRGIARGALSAALMAPLMGMPTVGRWLQLMAMSRMSWSLGMAVESGMDAVQCTEVALRSTQNRYFTQHMDEITQQIKRGRQLHEAFATPGLFSQDFLDAVEVGEQTGRVAESMEVLSRQYEEQGKAAMQALAVAGGVAVCVLVAAVMIFFIFRLAMFYVDKLNSFM